MNDATRHTRSSDIAALANATDPNGNVDLTAYQAYRLIYSHQSVDGLDAIGVVNEIVASSVYATEKGRGQVGSLIDAISARVSRADARRFDEALDAANVNDSWIERNYERYIEEPIVAGYETAKVKTGQALDWTDKQISDNLAAARKWAIEARDNPQNSYLARAAAEIDSDALGNAQNRYGAMKGATSHGLGMIGDTIDLVKFAHQFSNDRDFRNLVIGAAAVYANSAIEDPGKVPRDIKNAAVGAWNEWEAGYEKALKEGKENEYVGGIEGAAAIEIIATFVPATKLTNLAKVAKAVEVVDDLAPAAGRIAGRVEAHAGKEIASELVELAHDAQKLQAKGGVAAESADLMFHGLAGIKRSQGELGDLVEGFRKSGNLDGLLQSGALSPKELGHLARKDVSTFEGQVSIEKAIDAYIGKRQLAELTDPEVGDIGEAFVSHDLARKGYTDLVAIQNKQGHGIDVVGKNPEGHWESFEVKASVQGTARKQYGNPEEFITDRLEKAKAGQSSWAPKNMWEEQAQATASKILDDTMDLTTGKADIESKWARVNIERDPATGAIKAEPEIEKWKTPLERQQDRQLERSLRKEAEDQRNPAEVDHQDFALNRQIKGLVTELDHQNGRTPDATSDRMTASLLVLAKENGLTRVDQILLSSKTDTLASAQNVFVVQGSPSDPAMLRAHMPTVQAAQTPVEESLSRLEQLNQRLAQKSAEQHTIDQAQSLSQDPSPMRMA
ncbi:XVIPCD domain-containing protein [Stenotrophomonas maltophilia]|uniref:XVIPCD domain-containing protein n=1 Tax=Stenotrophomonas maltophilia TaxID=40324 RepID=UPI0039F696B6